MEAAKELNEFTGKWYIRLQLMQKKLWQKTMAIFEAREKRKLEQAQDNLIPYAPEFKINGMNCLSSLPDTFEDSPEGTKAMKETARKREETKKEIAKEGHELEAWIAKVNPPKTEIQIQNDKVKRVLRSYLYCQHQIDAACDEITKLDSRRKRITIQYRDVHGGGGSFYTETVIDNINILEREIIARTKQLQAERLKVQFWIDSLKDFRIRNVLTECYLNGLRFEEVAKELNYNYDYVRRLHGIGINTLRVLFKDEIAKMKKEAEKMKVVTKSHNEM